MTPSLHKLKLCLLFFVFAVLPVQAVPPPPPEVLAKIKADSQGALQFLYPSGRVYEYEGLFPLVLEFNNPSPLPQNYKLTWGSQLPVPKDLKNVKLEPGEKRRYTLIFPQNEVSNLYRIELNGQAYNHELVSSPRNLVTGIIAPKEVGFDYLRALKLEQEQNYNAQGDEEKKRVPLTSVSRIDSEVVPESWALLSSLDVILLYDLPALTLSKTQQSALLEWAQMGGTLVLVSNGLPEEFSGTVFETELPLAPSGVTTENGYVQLVGEAASDATELYALDAPLALKRDLLEGELVLITAPFTELGRLNEQTAQELWLTIYQDLPDNNLNQYGSTVKHRQFRNNLRDMPEHPRAKGGLMAAFLLFYSLIVGPLNLGILRKKDKMLWSFITVPVIALVFAIGAYMVNMVGRSSQPVLRELGVLEIAEGKSRGVGQSEALLYSPNSAEFTVSTAPQAVFQFDGYPVQDGFGLYDVTPDGGLKSQVSMGTWDIREFSSRSLIELESPLRVDIKFQLVGAGSESAQGAEVTIESPCPSLGKALIYSPVRGISEPFEIKAGPQTLPLKFSGSPGYNKFESIGPTEERLHPGQTSLLLDLSNNSTGFKPDGTYLLFWTDRMLTDVVTSPEAKHVGEYLVIAEVEP